MILGEDNHFQEWENENPCEGWNGIAKTQRDWEN